MGKDLSVYFAPPEKEEVKDATDDFNYDSLDALDLDGAVAAADKKRDGGGEVIEGDETTCDGCHI